MIWYEEKISELNESLYPFNNVIYLYLSEKCSDEYNSSLFHRLAHFMAEVDMLLRDHKIEIDEDNFDEYLNDDNDNIKRILVPLSEVYNLIKSDGALEAGLVYEPDIELVSKLSSLALDAAYYLIYLYAFTEEARQRLDEQFRKMDSKRRSARTKAIRQPKAEMFKHDAIKLMLEKINSRIHLTPYALSNDDSFIDELMIIDEKITGKRPSESNMPKRFLAINSEHNKRKIQIKDEYFYKTINK